MERIGIYGGSYNPPHMGHIQAARYGIGKLGLSKMLIVPSCISPHKQGELPVDGYHRKKMLELSFAGTENIEISDIELSRGGVSYTADTLEEIRKQYPDAELILFMGDDTFQSLHQWYRAEEILSSASIAVFCRNAKVDTQVSEEKAVRVYKLENPVIDVSSSDLRRMLVFGCASPFLQTGVEEYIRSQGLYDTNRIFKDLPLEELKQAVCSLVKPKRISHILGCFEEAVKLARHWGADETDAARAALLHDITKALDGAYQLTLLGEYGIIPDNFSRENPKTIHALTGSLVAWRIFGENERVCQAIAWHTTGKENMSLLEKIIYVVDYMEPTRNFPGVEDLRKAAYQDINRALQMGLEMTLSHLQKQGSKISPYSQAALAYLINNSGKETNLC